MLLPCNDGSRGVMKLVIKFSIELHTHFIETVTTLARKGALVGGMFDSSYFDNSKVIYFNCLKVSFRNKNCFTYKVKHNNYYT